MQNRIFSALQTPAFLPVIHVVDEEQALRNAHLAFEGGADGIFLISHELLNGALVQIYQAVRAAHPQAWIGINLLFSRSLDQAAAEAPETADALWTDDGGFRPAASDPTALCQRARERLRQRAPNARWFGGVSFKGQGDTHDVEAAVRAMRACAPFIDVPTTSGPGTGHAADPEKLRAMRGAAPGRPLAIASGVDIGNVDAFLPHVDAVLVATGVGASFTELDPAKVAALGAAIHRVA